METVITALGAMKKATSIEIAARTGLEQREVVNQLWDLKRRGLVSQHSKTWSSADANGEPVQFCKDPLVVKISEAMITDALRQHGAQSTEELATLLSTTNRKVASTLAMPINKGRIQRINDNGTFRFTIAKAADVSTEPTAAKDNNPVSVAAVLDSITPFAVARPDDLIIPTVRGVNREIRRAKAKVVQLERLRDAVREISKHKRLIQEVIL
ncbi:DUF1627 domain-containing protein [Scandinavium goeteborgense]|uniref:DUF1627 domain-containing protein n=1 Tax=Scandinavium goeteborgense TaxID=1851514 RepID=UPI0021663FDE|nr:DUF1627 domain-containing protein [Scandinavium goeteborgense]MCS2154737.1 DUF1627 domain-containing protein [Scandinavium goeteborgense]